MGKPVYAETQVTLPMVGGLIANWPAFWLTGQKWPATMEWDIFEGFGSAQYHLIWGPLGQTPSNPGGTGHITPGTTTHTFGGLWVNNGDGSYTTTNVYDGVIAGALTARPPMSPLLYVVGDYWNANGGPAMLGTSSVTRYIRVWK